METQFTIERNVSRNGMNKIVNIKFTPRRILLYTISEITRYLFIVKKQ